MKTIQNYYSQTHTVYEIKAEGVYEEIRSNSEMFNFNNYPSQNTMIIQISYQKNQRRNRGAAIEEFVRLMTKCIHSQKIKANIKAKEMNNKSQ